MMLEKGADCLLLLVELLYLLLVEAAAMAPAPMHSSIHVLMFKVRVVASLCNGLWMLVQWLAG